MRKFGKGGVYAGLEGERSVRADTALIDIELRSFHRIIPIQAYQGTAGKDSDQVDGEVCDRRNSQAPINQSARVLFIGRTAESSGVSSEEHASGSVALGHIVSSCPGIGGEIHIVQDQVLFIVENHKSTAQMRHFGRCSD